MSTTTSAWKLIRPNGRPTRCLLSAISGHCDVIVWNGASIVLWERHLAREEAQRRADELWTMLVAHGARPVAPETLQEERAVEFVRACPDCRSQTAGIRHRRREFLVVACSKCGQTWNGRDRSAAVDRRTMLRDGADRRRAA
jgi:ribosomal protein L37AE/L43A